MVMIIGVSGLYFIKYENFYGGLDVILVGDGLFIILIIFSKKVFIVYMML